MPLRSIVLCHSVSVPSTGRTRAVGHMGTSECLWRTQWFWWTTPSASSASSRYHKPVGTELTELKRCRSLCYKQLTKEDVLYTTLLSTNETLTWFVCISGGRCVWQEASEACHPISLYQLARLRGAFHPYRHAQVPQESQELQPPVCWTHRGPLQVSGSVLTVLVLLLCVHATHSSQHVSRQCGSWANGHLHRDRCDVGHDDRREEGGRIWLRHQDQSPALSNGAD